ncbi:MAG: hypothetical protein M3541_07100 [Acidobacteriota bacterium]|nr:hypothetical protein [Acidobacteriota bacterium]MDQ3418538.1 hypothetical protein [Acidobacteriota bacterium]
MTRRRLTLTGLVIAVISAGYLSVQTSVGAGALPEQLSDKSFWALSTELSEQNGYFRSANLVSNEVWMQHVIADLVKGTKPGRVYLGVGPEQNFTYIAATKPAMVFIVDVRRENLQLHLMYKALFELSKDRAEFVSRLFSKKRPQSLTTTSTAEEIFNAYAEVPTSEALYKENLKAIQDHLLKTRGLPLSEEDLKGVEYVAYQFYWFGPVITYSSTNPTNVPMRGGHSMPTYYDVMLSTDADGRNRGYLSEEGNFLFLKQLHSRNMLVPVVGNFGGPKALRAVGRYLREQGATVAAFYLSNVEQYLQQSFLIPAFCNNVASLPLDEQSTFIRSVRGGSPGGAFNGGSRFGGLVNQLGSMLAETRSCPK